MVTTPCKSPDNWKLLLLSISVLSFDLDNRLIIKLTNRRQSSSPMTKTYFWRYRAMRSGGKGRDAQMLRFHDRPSKKVYILGVISKSFKLSKVYLSCNFSMELGSTLRYHTPWGNRNNTYNLQVPTMIFWYFCPLQRFAAPTLDRGSDSSVTPGSHIWRRLEELYA